ncbi:MAG: phosphoadenosine phosphosulfate reductase [Xanthobacteraceae bacterium]|jgi:phosphoadenosine phosphosulfate reductase|nr:phosphoadenosine phosphosulfate reductase [Xanthobacteraceae bacterium]
MTEAEALHSVIPPLNRLLEGAAPVEIVAEAVRQMPEGRLAVVSSFGTESAVLLKLVADVDRALPVLFLDTGWLFTETLSYRDELTAHLGLTDVRTFAPSPNDLAAQDAEKDLWAADPDRCCNIRKVLPLARALAGFDGWINGRKRFQGGARLSLPAVELDGSRLKFNPLAGISQSAIVEMFDAAGLPRHPLAAQGFGSVGCMPCTSRIRPGEDPRAGRWRGTGRTECGIHSVER